MRYLWILINPIIKITERLFKNLKKIPFKYYLLTSFIVISSFTKQFAQESVYQFKQIKLEEGLSQSSVYCMIQDRKGFIWFGTANGLNRYDGYNFKVFVHDPLDTTSISDNTILSILEDSDGFIWVGTSDGKLNRFDRRTGTFKRIEISSEAISNQPLAELSIDIPFPFSRYNSKSITSIEEGNNNLLWIGTWGLGLIKFNKKTNVVEKIFYNEHRSNEFSFSRIRKIIKDGNYIWIGTVGSGLYKMRDVEGKISFTNYKNNLKLTTTISNNQIMDLMNDKEGNLWIATYGGGLNMLSKEKKNYSSDQVDFIKYIYNPKSINTISSNYLTSIIQDKYDKIWIGTFGGGLNIFDPSKILFKIFKNEPNISTTILKNEILSLLKDSSGNIWIGTHLGKGVNKYERHGIKFKQISRDPSKQKGLNDDVVWAICEDENKNLWIGTYQGGLNKWGRTQNKFLYFLHDENNPNSISDNHIRTIVNDKRGFIWIGTFRGGLNIYNKNTNKFINYKHVPTDSLSLSANQVQSIFIDKEKNTWIGTFGGGLHKIAPFEKLPSKIIFKKYKHETDDPFSLSDDRIYSIFEDSDGILWIGTFGGGLNKFDRKNEHFICYKNIVGDESSLSDNRVMGIFEDRSKNLWIATYGGGLNKFDKRKEKFTHYHKKHGINSTVVYGVIEDNKGNLWISSDNGIYKLSPRTELFTKYDLSDGLQSLEFSGGAYFKSISGEIFFGGINGFNYFHPDSVKDNHYIPPIVISTIKIFNEPIKGEVDSVFLSYDQNFLSIEFSALDFTNPLDNQYSYILEGIENEWQYVDSKNRIANYTSLKPGEYIFRVKGSNNDGIWNNVGTSLYIFISPPYWQTWWFIVLIALFVSFVIYYLSTIRYRNLLAIEKLKSKLSADLHDNIGSGLTEISILSELVVNEIKEHKTETVAKILTISERARQLIDNMSDIVWMVNPQRDSLYHVILRLKDSYSEIMNSLGISFQTVNLDKFIDIKLPMDYKQNIFLIFKEAINNSIKHSNCKSITLEALINKEMLEIILKDDGCGMDMEKIKYGNGILNMKSRATLINGSLEIESNNYGTKVKFIGKINRLKKSI